MFQTRIVNQKNYGIQSDQKKSRDASLKADQNNDQPNLPYRSRSTSILTIPNKLAAQHQTTTARQKDANNTSGTNYGNNNDGRTNLRNASDGPLPSMSQERKVNSVTPERNDNNYKNNVFRTPDPSRSKASAFNVGLSNSKINFRPADAGKIKLSSQIPNKGISSYAIKPAAFIDGSANKYNSQGPSQSSLPFRSRKEQYIHQGSIDNNQPQQAPESSQGYAFDSRKNSNNLLPKLEQGYRKPEDSPIINGKSQNLSNSAVMSGSQPGQERRMSKSKSKLFENNGPVKPPLPQSNEPKTVISQPNILIRKKPTDGPISGGLNAPGMSDRHVSPVRMRTSSANKKKLTQSMIEPSTASTNSEEKVIFNFAVKSKAGALPNKQTKTNQDSFITHPNFIGHKDKFFFGVSDGHGTYGHLVSNYIKQMLPKNAETFYKANPNEDSKNVREVLTQAFLKTNKELTDGNIDVNFSGATVVTCLIFNTRLWCANVGDSRAIVAKYKNYQWSSVAFSNDHKPDTPKEMERIIARGGRVDSFRDPYGDPIGPARVWLRDENIPGLAMSRSFGDGVAASVGCIPDPEILQFELVEEDRFIVIASDGIWEFLSNQQVVDYVVPFFMKNQLDAACEKLIKEATIRWKQEDEVIDDITCVIITLKVPAKP